MILGMRQLEQGPNSQPAIGDCDVVITPERLPAALLSDPFGFPQPLSKPIAGGLPGTYFREERVAMGILNLTAGIAGLVADARCERERYRTEHDQSC